jgi:hypothetical protein
MLDGRTICHERQQLDPLFLDLFPLAQKLAQVGTNFDIEKSF